MKETNKYINLINTYKAITYPSIALIIGAFVYSGYILFNLDETQKSQLNYLTIIGTAISIIGSFASIVGLIIAYFQIISIKKTTEETKIKVDNSLRKMNEVLMVSELSKSVQVLREIQSYLSEKRIDFAQMRMKDLKPALIQVKYNKKLQGLVSENNFNDLIQDFGLNLETINAHVAGSKKGFSIHVIDKNMENLATTLIHFEKEIINNHGKI